MTVSQKLLQVEITYELHDRLITGAEKLGVSKSDFVRMILIQALDNRIEYLPRAIASPLPVETETSTLVVYNPGSEQS